MEVRQHKSQTLLDLRGKGCILLAGNTVLRNHQRTHKEADTLAKYIAGDIIGIPTLDKGVSCHSESWNIATSDIEGIWMDKADLMDLFSY
jgi:hypothetical protein